MHGILKWDTAKKKTDVHKKNNIKHIQAYATIYYITTAFASQPFSNFKTKKLLIVFHKTLKRYVCVATNYYILKWFNLHQ